MAYGEFAKIYDELINQDINYKDISKKILEIAKENNINMEDYLDLACGTGNVGVELFDKVKNIYMVDLSEDMLSEAQNTFLDKKKPCRVVCQDITELNLMHEFDLITCVLDSTNYILEDEGIESYFKGVREHLKDEGIFIFDINSYYKLKEILGNNTYVYNEEDIFYSWENYFEDNIVSMFLSFFIKKGKLYERFDEEHEERAYKQEEIENLLKISGFKIINKYNGYSSEDVTDKSERIVYVTKKI